MTLKQFSTVLLRTPESKPQLSGMRIIASCLIGSSVGLLLAGMPVVTLHAASESDVPDSTLEAAPSVAERRKKEWKSAIANDSVDKLQTLWKQSGEDRELLNTRADNGKSAFMIACKTGHTAFFKRLLEVGEDPNSTTVTGGTPLMFAALGNHLGIARQLIELGADTDAQGSNGWSAMTIAAAKGYTDMVEFLASTGTDINAIDVYGWTPIMRAVDNGHFDTVHLMSVLAKVDLDNQDEAGNTALHHAVVHRRIEMVERLLQSGASPKVLNHAGQSPVQLATSGSGSDVLRSLLEGSSSD